MAIPEGYRTNFNTLLQAAETRDLALMECRRRSDGATVFLVCAVGEEETGEFVFSPFAQMIDGNPYELYDPPNPDGGFVELEESHNDASTTP